ncbi:MAG: TIGR00366 family protein [Phycisphaerales bacterium]|nr:short-chain fatty acid transporter [Planctomycetota bacterium]MCH8509875.1 TIGR00366 family protein [Phycisphaerales bacterium]
MIARLGRILSAVFARTAPDPFVLAVLLTLVAFGAAAIWGRGPGETAFGLARTMDAWRDPSTGLWRFLAFAMQMCLILVTGHALAESRPVRAAIRAFASLPKRPAPAAAMVGLVAMAFGLINWGLGLIVGALLARDVARALEARGVRVHAPLLAAAGYTGMLVWHGGFSGSAPLTMVADIEAARVLPPDTIRLLTDELGEGWGIDLSRTLLSPMNLFVTGGLLILVPALLWLLTPGKAEPVTPMPAEEELFEDPPLPARSVPDFLERTPLIPVILAGLILWALWRFHADFSVLRMGLNEINMLMLAAGLLAHGSVRSYVASAERGAKGCAGIILQFPLYAGIMGVLAVSGLIAAFAGAMAANASEQTLPVYTMLSAGVVNLFVPSGGGQWGIQGPVALEAGLALGIAPEKMIMAVAYGDQLTNMLQPFWALPLLAITGLKARDIVGYTAVIMVAAGAWMALGLLLF